MWNEKQHNILENMYTSYILVELWAAFANGPLSHKRPSALHWQNKCLNQYMMGMELWRFIQSKCAAEWVHPWIISDPEADWKRNATFSHWCWGRIGCSQWHVCRGTISFTVNRERWKAGQVKWSDVVPEDRHKEAAEEIAEISPLMDHSILPFKGIIWVSPTTHLCGTKTLLQNGLTKPVWPITKKVDSDVLPKHK